MPYGWIIDKDDSIPTASERLIHSKAYKAFTLRPKRHAVIDFTFKIDNVVEGHVYDQKRRPLADASIGLISEEGNGSDSFKFTDKKGRFKFESFSAGRYKLIVFEDKPGQLTRTGYYDPQKSNLLTTLIVNLKQGESRRGLEIFVPTMDR